MHQVVAVMVLLLHQICQWHWMFDADERIFECLILELMIIDRLHGLDDDRSPRPRGDITCAIDSGINNQHVASQAR
jgi:hypothetical protein